MAHRWNNRQSEVGPNLPDGFCKRFRLRHRHRVTLSAVPDQKWRGITGDIGHRAGLNRPHPSAAK